MGFRRATVGLAYPVLELVAGEQVVGFDDATFAVDPGGLDGVEPGALARQIAGDDPHTPALLLDQAVVRPDPAADQVAGAPGGSFPHQTQPPLAARVELTASPG